MIFCVPKSLIIVLFLFGFILPYLMRSTKNPTLWLTTLGCDAPPLVSRPWSPLTCPSGRRHRANYLVYILTGTICACWLGEHADDSPGETTHAHPHTRYKCTHWLGHQLATNKCPAGGHREAGESDLVTWPITCEQVSDPPLHSWVLPPLTPLGTNKCTTNWLMEQSMSQIIATNSPKSDAAGQNQSKLGKRVTITQLSIITDKD